MQNAFTVFQTCFADIWNFSKEKCNQRIFFVLHTRLLYALSLIFVLHFHYSLSSSIISVWIIYFIIKNLYLCNIFANYGLKKGAISWFDQEFDRWHLRHRKSSRQGYNLIKMQFLHACTKSLYIVNVDLLLFYFIVPFWHSLWPNRSMDCNIRRIISNSASIHKFSLC